MFLLIYMVIKPSETFILKDKLIMLSFIYLNQNKYSFDTEPKANQILV
jgi:hypothetical protein